MGPRLCGGGVPDHPSSGENQREIRESSGQISHSSPQLTPAQGNGRKRKFRVPRFVAGNQAVSMMSVHWTLSPLRSMSRKRRPNRIDASQRHF